MKQLMRSRTDRVLFGVCGGIAEYWGVNADIVRAGWIFLILLGGVGLLPYAAALLLVPEGEDSPGAERKDALPRFIGLTLIFLAGFVVMRQFGVGILEWWSPRLFIPLLLLGGGILLVWPETREKIGLGGAGKVERSVSNRVLAGVAGGIAEKLGTDANLVRIGFVLIAGMTVGLGALLYVILTILVPEERIEIRPAPAPSPSGGGTTPPAPGTTDAPGATSESPPAAEADPGAAGIDEGRPQGPGSIPEEAAESTEAPPAPAEASDEPWKAETPEEGASVPGEAGEGAPDQDPSRQDR